MKKPALTLALLFLLCTPHGFSQGAAPKAAAKAITSVPTTITASGVYYLNSDLVSASGTLNAITVTAPNVTIDLGGRTLSMGADQDSLVTAIGITVSGSLAKNLTIRNGTIENFREGIGFDLLSDLTLKGYAAVRDVTVRNSGVNGIRITARSIHVEKCRITETGYIAPVQGTSGILLYGADLAVNGNVVTAVTANVSGITSCIRATATSTAFIEGNTLNGGASNDLNFKGIYLQADAPATGILVGNSAVKVGYGYQIRGTGTVKYRSNLTNDVGIAFSGGTASGSENN